MDYKDFTVSKLKNLLEERKLSTKGVKSELIERLEEDDGKKSRSRVFSYRGRDIPQGQERVVQGHRSDSSRLMHDELGQHIPPYTSTRARANPEPDTHGRSYNDRDVANHPQPYNESEETNLRGLSETALEALCRDNYLPFHPDNKGVEERATINVECDLKGQESRKKRDADFTKAEKIKEKAQKKFETDMAGARTERDDKLKGVNLEVAERYRKQKIFRPAFDKLKVSSQISSILTIQIL